MKQFVFFIALGAGLLACSPHLNTGYRADRISVQATDGTAVSMDSLIAPYRRELAVEMNRVLGTNEQELAPERPNSLLGQWVSDIVLQYGSDSLLAGEAQFPVICLLNTGGLRASLPKGPVTVGDVYKVMPFDNQVVALKLPVSQLQPMADYLKQSGGEPIAGCVYVSGTVRFEPVVGTTDYFWVVTSDFLANGGDKMLFLQQAVERKTTGKLMRDLLLQAAEQQAVIRVLPERRIQ